MLNATSKSLLNASIQEETTFKNSLSYDFAVAILQSAPFVLKLGIASQS